MTGKDAPLYVLRMAAGSGVEALAEGRARGLPSYGETPTGRRGRSRRRSVDANDEEGDRDVLARERDDRQRVEELVVTEHPR